LAAGLRPEPLGELKRPRPPSCNQGGPTSKGRERREREGRRGTRRERKKSEKRERGERVGEGGMWPPNVESWIRQCSRPYKQVRKNCHVACDYKIVCS